LILSGRADLNRRPHGPEPCALAGLSHAPNSFYLIFTGSGFQTQDMRLFEAAPL
jgi:hypothetical protein